MEENNDQAAVSEAPKNKNQLYVILAVVAFVVISGIAFITRGQNDGSSSVISETEQTEEPLLTEESTTEAVMSAETSSDVKKVIVEAGSFYFKPSTITLKKGEKVQLVLTAKDMMHDFNIDELKVHVPVTKSGETQTVEFTPDKVGKFEYYCSVGSHRKNGQVGEVTVTN